MDFLNIKPERIFYIKALAEHKSYAKAAHALCITEQTLRNNIKALEQDFGAKLFDSDSSSLELSSTGQKIINIGVAFLENLNQTQSNILASRKEQILFNIGCAYAFETDLLAKYLHELTVHFPQQQIATHTSYDHKIEQLILSGQLNCGFSIEAPRQTETKCIVGPKLPGVFVKRNNGINQKIYLLPQIWPYGTNPHAQYPELNLSYPIRYIAQSRLLLQLCLSGAGIAYLPLLKALPYLQTSELEVIRGPLFDFEHHLHLLWASGKNLSPYENFLIQYVSASWLELQQISEPYIHPDFQGLF